MRKLSIILSLLLIARSTTALAAPPVYSNEFLSIGVGGRALGMGGGAVASVEDASAAYWNPARLLNIPSTINASLMHAEYFAGIAKFDFAGFAYKPDSTSALGATFVRFGIDDIPNTIDLIDRNGNLNYDRIRYFSVADYALYLSAARKLWTPKLQLGATAKIIYRNLGAFASAYGFGIDLGAHYAWHGFQLGLTARDVTTTFNYWSYNAAALAIPDYIIGSDTISNRPPGDNLELTLPKFSLGLARNFRFPKRVGLLVELGFDFTTDGQRNTLVSSKFLNIDPKLGLELHYLNMIFLRAGVNNLQRITQFDNKKTFALQPNMGLGLTFKGWTIDYAITNLGAMGVATYSHVFSLSYSFH